MDSISQNNGGEIRKLCRFTNISILLDILNRKKLFMPNYNSWDNKIDTDILDYYLYKMNKKHGTVELRALCFSHGDESIHHWNCYSNDMTGCCIEFDYNSLLQSFEHLKGIHHGVVNYYRIKELEYGNTPPLAQLPFSRRWPYRVEQEYRIIHLSDRELNRFDIPIDLKSISKITISHKMPESVSETVRKILGKDVDIVNRSTFLNNNKWLKLVRDNA